MIEVITMMYNEEKLLPFFLDHYKWADIIHVILDQDSNDQTEKILRACPYVEIHPYKFPDMMDDELKVQALNDLAGECEDWIINVDADEFIFRPDGSSVKEHIEHAATGNAIYVAFYEIFRHRTEKDLDYSKPSLHQRCHGNPKAGWSYGQNVFNKPIVVKREIEPQWLPGNHILQGKNIKWSMTRLYGAHWSMADVDIAIERRIRGRKERQSKNNIAKNLTYQHYHITEEQIREECEKMLDSPQVIKGSMIDTYV